MPGKKYNYYNVTKDCELILKGVTNQEAAHISGCHPNQISTYANNGRGYHGKEGVFKFEVSSITMTIPKPVIDDCIKMHCTHMTPEQIRDWEKYRFMINKGAKKREVPTY
jgi:hypothetical protein